MARTKPQKFAVFFAKAQKKRGKYLTTYFAVTKMAKPTSAKKTDNFFFALASKKAVDKRSVYRNLARRRLRAAAALIIKSDTTVQPNDITWILFGTRNTPKSKWIDIMSEVQEHWNFIKTYALNYPKTPTEPKQQP